MESDNVVNSDRADSQGFGKIEVFVPLSMFFQRFHATSEPRVVYLLCESSGQETIKRQALLSYSLVKYSLSRARLWIFTDY